MTDSDPRIDAIRTWLAGPVGWNVVRLEAASADASFRRYFRVWRADGATRIVMDAPPDKEDTAPLSAGSRPCSSDCGVHVPRDRGCREPSRISCCWRIWVPRRCSRSCRPAMMRMCSMAMRSMRWHGSSYAVVPALAKLAPYDAAALLREMAVDARVVLRAAPGAEAGRR